MQVLSMYDNDNICLLFIAQCMTGVLQFLATYRRMQHLENDPFFYGDELAPWLSLGPGGLRWSKGPSRVQREKARLSRF